MFLHADLPQKAFYIEFAQNLEEAKKSIETIVFS